MVLSHGYDDGYFYPNKEVSIQEFLKILIVQENYKLNTTGPKWPNWYINTAIDNNLIDSSIDDFSAPITRLEACRIISNYIVLDDVPVSKKSFKDLSKENSLMILKLVNLGVIDGFKDNTFRENDIVTRAQACKIIHSAYKAKNELVLKRDYEITPKNSNIGVPLEKDVVTKNRFETDDGHFYINDSGRYAKFNHFSLNSDFIDEKLVIKAINAMVDDYSYTEVMYVPDANTINALNICYGKRQDYVDNGTINFQVRFYENGNYNVSKYLLNDKFCNDAFMKIELDRMWDKSSEYDGTLNASDKNLGKLKKLCSELFEEEVAKKLVDYLKEKLIEASSIPDNDFQDKISEVKKIGKYTFNIFCSRGQKIMVFVKRP